MQLERGGLFSDVEETDEEGRIPNAELLDALLNEGASLLASPTMPSAYVGNFLIKYAEALLATGVWLIWLHIVSVEVMSSGHPESLRRRCQRTPWR